MKKLVALMTTVAVVAIAGVAMAKSAYEQPTQNEQVQQAIDARLHVLMVQMQSKRFR